MTVYLDSARMGRFGVRSQSAVADFMRLHTDEGSSVHFDEFLRSGFRGLNKELFDDFPGLCDWNGIQGLKGSIRKLAGVSVDSEVFFASSSSELLRIAARAAFERCRNILTLDIAWPDYRKWLQAEADRTGRHVSELVVGEQILRSRISKDSLLQQISARYIEQGCDGLFLPAVSNLGIRLPYTEIIELLQKTGPVRFVVIDGAQDFCHIPTSLGDSGVDLYVTGCHKWMQAYLPMRMGILCRQESQELVDDVCKQLFQQRILDDALLRFTQQLEQDDCDPYTETANVLPVFSCAAAVAEQLTSPTSCADRLLIQRDNTRLLDVVSRGTSWSCLLPDPDFRSGVMLMECRDRNIQSLDTDEIRRRFRAWGICLSAYEGGIVRLSMPTRPWRHDEEPVLAAAFKSFDQPVHTWSNPRRFPIQTDPIAVAS